MIDSRLGGLPEQITPECGLLFDANDADQLAGCMSRLLEDSDLRHRMGQAARRRVQEVYSPENHVERLLTVFSQLVSGTAPELVAQKARESAPCSV